MNKLDDNSKETLLVHLKEYFEAAPQHVGTTLFFYTLLSCITPYMRKPVEMVVCVKGIHGSMKTTSSNVVADCEVKFSDINLKDFKEIKKNFIEQEKSLLLVDDLFPQQIEYSVKRQAEIFGKLARGGDRSHGNLGIVVTLERFPKLVASGRDRIWVIDVPKFKGTSEEKNAKWNKLVSIPEGMVKTIMKKYSEVLNDNSDLVRSSIADFLDTYKLPDGVTYDTRIALHAKHLLLSEYIFRTYFLGNTCSELYDYQEYASMINKSSLLQQEEVLNADKEADLVAATYRVLTAHEKYVQVCEKKSYQPNGHNYTFVRPGVYMISFDALQFALNQYMGCTVSRKALYKALKEAGVVEMEGNNVTKSTSQYHCRHAYIHWELLLQYMRLNSLLEDDEDDEDEYIIKIIRKQIKSGSKVSQK